MDWLTLQKGEKIIAEYKPSLAAWLLVPVFGRIVLAILLAFAAIVGTGDFLFGILAFIIMLVLQFVAAFMTHSHAYYIITNKRLVQKNGFIGYSVKSVSYNRLADVIVRHSMMEKIFGVGSILIQTLAGQISAGRRGAEFSFLYLKNPEEAQQTIYRVTGK